MSNEYLGNTMHHFTDEYIRQDNHNEQEPGGNVVLTQESSQGNGASQSTSGNPSNEYVIHLVSSFSDQLRQGEASKQLAINLYGRVQQYSTLSATVNEADHQQEKDRYLAACAVFLASRIRMDNARFSDIEIEGVSVRAIQRDESTELKLVELFDLINSCIASLKFEQTEFYKKFNKVQKKLVILDHLYELYESFYSEFFNRKNEDPMTDTYFAFGWLLFIVVGNQVQEWLSDFETCYHVFASTMLFFWENAHIADLKIMNVPKDDVCKFLMLCSLESLEKQIVELPHTTIARYMQSGALKGDGDVKAFFSNVENMGLLNAVCDSFEQQNNSLSFDERNFFKRAKLIGTTSKLSSAPIYQMKSYKSLTGPLFELSSPRANKESVKVSPLESTLLSILHVQNVLKNVPCSPDAELVQFFGSNKNLAQAISNRVTTLIDLTNAFCVSTEAAMATRRAMCQKFYYFVLHKMLQAEERRLRQSDFSILLNNDNFHRSLIACSIEAILFIYNMKDQIDMTELLSILDIPSFELSKIIESFVIHCEGFPSVFIRHFRTIEEQIFDSLAWQKDSSLFEMLRQFDVPVGSSIPAGLLSPEGKKPSSMFNSLSQNRRSLALDFFFRKVHQLATKRIYDLCDKFDTIPEDYKAQIVNVVDLVLHEERELMQNRHIDHLIMCTMYAVCNKVKGMKNLTFKDIIYNYRTICENVRNMSAIHIGKILWQVPLDQNEGFGDIVKFYNKVFIPRVKNFILRAPNEFAQAAQDSLQTVRSPLRKRVGKANLFISPLRKSAAPSTPKTKEKYLFGEHHSTKVVDGGVSITLSTSMEDDDTSMRKTKRQLFSSGSQGDSSKKRKLTESAKRELFPGANDPAETQSGDDEYDE